MPSERDLRILAEIARMYYDEGATQADIAAQYSISRSLVSKYLSRARELGIVEIIIHDDFLHPFRNLEKKLAKRFGFEEVVIIPAQEDKQYQKNRVGTAAAQYLLKQLPAAGVVAIAPGTTIHAMAVSSVLHGKYPDLTFVPLTGGMGTEHQDIQANVLCSMLAGRLSAQKMELHAPVSVDTEEARDILLAQSSIKSVFQKAKNADIAIVGIGGSPVYSTVTKAYLNNHEQEEEYSHPSIVGDVCYNFIDRHGHLVDCAWNRRVISLDLESLRKVPMVIAVAEGTEKLQGIAAALAGGILDVLVTDSQTAEALLELS